jgi:hypothetical protein
VSQNSRFRRGDWDCEMRVEIKMTADATHYFIDETLSALKNGQPVLNRHRAETIPRRLT